MFKRKFSLSLSILLAGLAFSAPLAMHGSALAQGTTNNQEAPNDLVQAAKKEGGVVFYGASDDASLTDIANAFKARYGIPVVFQRLASGPQRERIEQEVTSGKVMFDVSQLSDEAWVVDAGARGFWAKLDPERMPNLKLVPKNLQRDDYAVGGIVALTTIYNTDNVKPADVPKTSDDLLNPRWKGRFALVSPDVGLSIRTGYYLWLKKYGEAGYEKYMRDLFAQNPRVVSSGANGTQQVAAGELDFVVLASATFAAEPKGRGAPIELAFPDPTGGSTRTFQIAKNAVHPNAARLFLNWMMSLEGLELIDGKQQAAPPYGTVPTALKFPDSVQTPLPGDVEKASELILKLFRQYAAVKK